MHQQTSIDSNNTRNRSQSEPPPSPPTNRNIVRSDSEEKLQAKRREWEESTAKRNVKTYFLNSFLQYVSYLTVTSNVRH